MYKKFRTNENFKKSIESTVKAIAEQKNLNVFFGETDKTKNHDILLPTITDTTETTKVKMVRGMSDSASLIKKFHNAQLHKKLSPTAESQKKIFISSGCVSRYIDMCTKCPDRPIEKPKRELRTEHLDACIHPLNKRLHVLGQW